MKNFSLTLVVFCFFSCTKDTPQDPDPTPQVPTGTFLFHLHTYIDVEEVDLYGIDYQTLGGRTISLDLAQMYLSDIQLVKADGSLYNFTGKTLLKKFETHTYLVGEAPVGTYKSIRFKVGLLPTTNALAPSASPDSVILNEPGMWFGNAAQPDGYVFLNVAGKVDTSSDFSHPPVPFSYKIGTNANLVQVNMGDRNFKIEEGNATYGHLIIDYSKLFNGIALSQPGNLSIKTLSDNSTSTAEKIANNIQSMFIYE